jgi:hypothetical protein
MEIAPERWMSWELEAATLIEGEDGKLVLTELAVHAPREPETVIDPLREMAVSVTA